MSGSPTISVVVTCYNLGRYLDEAVGSVLAQTFQDFEILVVNDGSTDPETLALLSSYERPRTRVVHIENRGLPGARNEGIRQTTGRYVCALDADDRLEPTYFDKAVAVLEADPSVAFVSHWLRTFGDEDWEWKPERCDLAALLAANTVNGAAIVRREAIATVGGFDEAMRHGCEDWAFWLALVERGFRGVILPEVLFFYRRRSDSMSRLMIESETYLETFRDLIRKHEPSYRRHFVDVLLQREARIAALLRGVHDLELEYETWLRPALRDQGEDRDGLRSKVERVAREAEAERERCRVAAAEAAAERTLTALEQARQDSEDRERRLGALTETCQAMRMEVEALRASWSWRLTAPLRAAGGWLQSKGR